VSSSSEARPALWITAERPDPRLSGGNIRQHYMLQALAEAVPTDLLLLGDVVDGAPVASGLRRVHEMPAVPRGIPEHRLGAWALNAYLAGPGGPREAYVHRPTIAAARRFLRTSGRDYGLVVVEHAFLAPVGSAVRGGRSVLTLHNIASAAAAQQAALVAGRRRWLAEREVASWKRLERRAERDFTVLVTVSDSDAGQLEVPSVTVPNGVDCARFPDAPTGGEPGQVLFLGHLNFPPNTDGLGWLSESIWARVLERAPSARLDVVGREPNAQVRAAVSGMPGAVLHPDVTSVDPFLARAAVSVVPLRFGTGTRLKALEAMAAGVPLVGTSIGLDGLGIVDGTHALVRDAPEDLAVAVASLLADRELALRLATAGQALARERFDWQPLASAFVTAATGRTS
jgi:glycosyltransferase involved in cell wall biosynthesis